MSYILEALKKSQAERQLGELPTLHAPQLQTGPAGAGGVWRQPLWLALGATSLLALTLAVLMWRQAAPTVVPAAPVVAAPALPAAAPAPPAAPAIPAAPAPPAAAPAAAVVARVAPPRPPLAAPKAPKAAAPAAAIVVEAAPAVAPPPAAADDNLAGLRELPEAVQRQLPALALGGYIYSKDPASRLLLIDKVLRHEGEEVAPGLILEKLLPKGAVFNFKGYRYRVPY
ncbi:general secretion pathway protein GspB [Janthinobacterium fluminis]|uniref:General secretion pathway protein GspB n=1 Tax=Janthinobacterium fluminis TaxID=2987524 RepID=A0ABT5JXG8_9BURK|nr:general secretion pathway protein GspB [Janthinobacterium fluminis]MDC8757432.1 general secretion pathway protein GspB [Janthinobacterium fluminis]